MSERYFEGIGRRKESTARVRVSSGTGKFIVNQKELEAYFTRAGDPGTILEPFAAAGDKRESYDVSVHVKGGGVTGQTDAVLLGLARALVKFNPENHTAMRKGGYLTRNPLVKERKKPGLKKARKAPTYTKR
ncbi:MAG: 30S ribosomal protein S9 [Anaerolineales bacterium]|uniref:Small ribosomal subunit protein uS9 n=1 Tax=Candidatus Desulfolinea nitratireducens TaxID=2841698 RepID=A0A8J6TJ18_9CHLR|nr:30S ribosomal protein S9 [Candidatus Desulfolinea nitratireducens]MBL6960598.1 30S ribosomal protein S9 [Anaerolineales bacterium]